MRMTLAVQPLRGLREIDGPTGWWQAIGQAFAFRLLAGRDGLPKGWTQFVVPIQAPRDMLDIPRLQVDLGAGFQPLATFLVRRPIGRGWQVTVYVPSNALALALSVAGGPTPFYLGPVQATPTRRAAVVARWLLPLALRLLRQRPQLMKALRSLGQIWHTQGRIDLRDAMRRQMSASPPLPRYPDDVAPPSPPDRYARWIVEQEATQPAPRWANGAAFSLLVPLGVGDAKNLAATLASLRSQVETNWECRLGLAPGLDAAERAAILRQAADPRIFAMALGSSERGAMLAALNIEAQGSLLLVLDPGDRLAPGALVALAVAADHGIAHGDEDRMTAQGQRETPFLKPEYSPELLHAFNYFGRPTVLRRDLVAGAGGFTAGLGAAAEWDLHLRLAASPVIRVARVAKILCYRHHTSSGDRPAPDTPAAAEHRAAIAAHWQRMGSAAIVATQADGTQRSRVAHPAPLLSIIVLVAGDIAQLVVCLEAIAGQGGLKQVLVVGDSPCASIARRHNVGFIAMQGHASRAAACNAAIQAATGRLLLFLDAGLEPVGEDWLAELSDMAQRPGVGIAGTLRIDPAGAVLDAGFHLGAELYAPSFCGAAPLDWGPAGSAFVPRTLTIVAGGCQMVRREVIAQVGGFDETYNSSGCDIALCLAARAVGWRVVYSPFAAMVQSPCEAAPRCDMARLAADIVRFGYAQDPFFHPALDVAPGAPRLRLGHASDGAAALAQSLRQHGGILPHPWPLDLYHDTDISAATGIAIDGLLWPPQHQDGIGDIWSAARWCLDLLRRRPDLRRRFPDALSAGAAGCFATWVANGAASEIGLPAVARGHILAALSAGIAGPPRQAVLAEAGLVHGMECAFLPSGRDRLFGFLLQREGKPLRLEEVWWLALECAEDPTREVAFSYHFNPDWQCRFPDAASVFGRDRFADWFRTIYRCDGAFIEPERLSASVPPAEQLRLAWQARPSWQQCHPAAFASRQAAQAFLDWLAQPESGLPTCARDWLAAQPATAQAMTAPGINVIGHFGYPSGLRTSALSVVAGLRSAGLEVVTRNVPVDTLHELPGHAAHAGLPVYDITLLHIQPEPYFTRAFELAGLHDPAPRGHRIAYWFWELETAPPGWMHEAAQVDEIWTATRFVGDALRALLDTPVFELMPGAELPPFTRRGLAEFGIPTGHFAFLFTFHMMSGMERKNPLGLIRAFRIAFTADDPVVLVIKTSYGAKYPALIRQLHQAAAEKGGRVMVIDAVFSPDETISMMEACHAYVSLHRSEGLGLTMAEAMLLAKPVIATGYSGNMDFMNVTNSWLVEYRLVEIDKAVPPYQLGARWAEPSEAHAAVLMRALWENPAEAAVLGLRAQADIRARFSLRTAGRRMADRLAAIAAAKAQM